MKRKLTPVLLVALVHSALASAENVVAANFTLDSFSQGDLAITSDERNSRGSSVVNSPLGSLRSLRINSRRVADGAEVTSTVDSTSGTLSSEFSNSTNPLPGPLEMRLGYSGGGPFDLLGANAFEFDFSTLSGSGFLIAELGSESAVFGPDANRITLDNSGTISVPFSELNFGENGSIESFDTVSFVFEAESEDFSFTLDEIRAVPEPSSFFLLTMAGAVGLTRRKRNHPSSQLA